MNANLQFDPATHQLTGPGGSLPIPPTDQQAHRFLMLMEGQCLQANISDVAQKYGYCRQRYYQLLKDFAHGGCKYSVNTFASLDFHAAELN